jgi:hypothetical protein
MTPEDEEFGGVFVWIIIYDASKLHTTTNTVTTPQDEEFGGVFVWIFIYIYEY